LLPSKRDGFGLFMIFLAKTTEMLLEMNPRVGEKIE
jgi:hypothetical protein